MSTGQNVIRQSKDNGLKTRITWDEAVERLAGAYVDPSAALDVATESHPAQTHFSLFWVDPS